MVSQEELKPEDLVGPRLLKKKKPKEVHYTHTTKHSTYMHMLCMYVCMCIMCIKNVCVCKVCADLI